MRALVPTVAVIGYASLDSSTSTAAFRGIDATSILDRPIYSTTPGLGGIAHLARAVVAAGVRAEAVSWVGADSSGSLWKTGLDTDGSGTGAVAISGTRTPAATLIEVASGGTICLFDPGDCHSGQLAERQLEVIAESDWVLLTVAPRQITAELLSVLPHNASLAWAVKHDDDAYTPAMVCQLLERADVVSFSRGERSYLTIDDIDPEGRTRPGALVVETRGADGVSWSFSSHAGPTRQGTLPVERIDAADPTGAGDTFVGDLIGRIAALDTLEALSDEQTTQIVAHASRAATTLLRDRTNPGQRATAPPKEIH
ncbi:carbohydrate kinase family protein [Glaciihabitans sp. UYNi722]|uniref:carbohydrate kinase family protein n=1 Tax=Glaciihabitans sp. UYNi722 TaxID=3156344 RepID=UPI003392710F